MLRLLPVALFLVVAVTLGLALLQRPEDRSLPPVMIGQPFPEMNLPVLQGKVPQGARVINVFASWCVPCATEAPLLAELDAPLIGIAWKDKPERINAWLIAHNNPFNAVLLDEDGSLTVPMGLTGVPETYIVDADNIVRYRLAGPMTPHVLARDVLPLLESLHAKKP